MLEYTNWLITTYTVGDDVITQKDDYGVMHLLYDGHGSTRQLTDSNGDVFYDQVFNYDGYGVRVGYTSEYFEEPLANLQYAGEYYDNNLRQYNLRARWYDPLIGRFNQLDPYAGNNYDPQSLHKYLYCHANPVNAVDPSGLILWSPYLGTIVHEKIGWHFRSTSLNERYSNRSINRILKTRLTLWGLDRPDLVDVTTQEVYEIKPFGMFAAGQTQLYWYLMLLNLNDPQHRLWKPGITYLPKYVIEINTFCIATVDPPINGVIQYRVIDMPTILAFIATIEIYRLMAEVQMATVRAVVLRTPF